jgi:hypothetical protein
MKGGKIKYAFEFVGGNTTVIRRTMPDKSERFVGFIIPDIDKRSGRVLFKSYGGQDNSEVLPPKEKFAEAAVQFENHLRGREREVKIITMPARQNELKSIRKKKQKSKRLQR